MLTTLPESRRSRRGSMGGTAASFVAHWVIVLALVVASADARSPESTRREEAVIFQKAMVKDEPSAPQPPATEVAAPPPLRDVTKFTAPIDIPTVLPDIDLRRSVTDPEAFAIRAPRGGGDDGAPVAGAALPSNAVLTAWEVEEPVRVSGQPVAPAYPDALRRAGVEGEVLVTFVVDTLGVADLSTLAVIRSTHDLFTQAVRTAIGQQSFTPATIGSRAVRQLVQQPYSFTIRR